MLSVTNTKYCWSDINFVRFIHYFDLNVANILRVLWAKCTNDYLHAVTNYNSHIFLCDTETCTEFLKLWALHVYGVLVPICLCVCWVLPHVPFVFWCVNSTVTNGHKQNGKLLLAHIQLAFAVAAVNLLKSCSFFAQIIIFVLVMSINWILFTYSLCCVWKFTLIRSIVCDQIKFIVS